MKQDPEARDRRASGKAGTRRTVVMVGPGGLEVGGIDSVIRTYRESKLSERYDVRFVATSKGGSLARRYATAAAGLTHIFLLSLRRGHPLFHVHMAQKGSFSRKSLVIRMARVNHCPTVLHLHGSGFDTWAGGVPEAKKVKIARTFKAAGEVIVLSEEWRQKVEALTGRADAIVLHNPVRLPPLEKIAAPRKPLVAFLGRLGDRKGVPELLRAIEILQREGVDADYVLAGDGEIERFRAVAAALPHPERVSLPGWLGRSEIAELLETCSVFCLPSWAEGQPIALLEAMAAATACVVTPVGGIPSTITDGENGLLVEPGDVDALAGALRRLIQDPAERQRLGQAARAYVEQTSAIDGLVDRLCAVYSGLGCPPVAGG